MTIASTSSTFCTEATPAPSAAIASSMSSTASLSLALQRARPDAARQPVAAAVAHDVEQVGLVALLLALAGADLHRAAAGVGLHAAAPPAGAARAVALDDHVADLAGGAAADPRAPVEDDAAADAGAPEHAEQRAVRAPGAEQRLGVGGHLHVVAERDAGAERLATARRPSGKLALPVGQVARAGHRALLGVDVARRADADAVELGGLDAGRLGGLLQRARPSPPRRRRARRSSAWARASRRAPRGRRRRPPPGSSCRRGRCHRAWRERTRTVGCAKRVWRPGRPTIGA